MTDRPLSQQARDAGAVLRDVGLFMSIHDARSAVETIQAFADSEVSRVKARIAGRLCGYCAKDLPRTKLLRSRTLVHEGPEVGVVRCAASAVWDEEE